MQLFKYFDVQGYGMLTEDEFVDGWRGLAEKPLDVLGVYVNGHVILKKIKLFVQ